MKLRLTFRIASILTLITTLAATLYAQDTTSITFSQETETVTDQRFIDRYGNVFMTKVPTKKVLKLGYTTTAYKGIGFSGAFEYKLFPSLSLETAIYSKTNRDGAGIYLRSFDRQLSGRNLFASAGVRWYLNMNKRIALEQSANNFTGNYLLVSYERSLARIQNNRNREHFSLSYGFQSRFLNNGFLDFSLGLFYIKPFSEWYTLGNLILPGFHINNMVIASRSLIGLAFGDWKRSNKAPLCDVLHCDYFIKEHFKIRLPEVNVGVRNQSIRAEAAHERKLGRSALTANLNVSNELYRVSDGTYWAMRVNGVIEAQLRYYYLQKRQIRKGKSSDNLSGLYAGTRFGYIWNYEQYFDKDPYTTKNLTAGVLTGYQQRLFNGLYFDASVAFSGISIDNDRFYKVQSGEFNAKAGVGFAF